ncbi:MAG: GNAT family protein [Anaerolineae bacterium]
MSTLPVLRSGPVTLRPPVPEDIADRLRIGAVPEFVTMCGGVPDTRTPYTEAQAQTWYEQAAAELYGWCIQVEGRCIGAARLHTLDAENRRARYAIGIFDPSAWGHGYGTRATRLVIRFAFEDLALHRVDLRVLAYNARAIACYTRCGLRQEGVERDGAWVGDAWHDDVMMSILEHEYRQLRDSWGDTEGC